MRARSTASARKTDAVDTSGTDAVADSFAAWPETIAATDAMHFKGEHDLRTRGTGHFIYILDSTPQWDRFVRVWDRASRILPPLHKRVVKPSVPGRLPAWRDDPDFDLNFHLRRIGVAAPGGIRQVLDYAEIDGMTPHDPARPLWQVTLMEGLDGGRAAVLMKFHHAWLDGMASIQLALIAYDMERDGDLAKPMPERPSARAERPHDSPAGSSANMARKGQSVLTAAGHRFRRVASDPGKAIGGLAEVATSARRLMNPVKAKPSPLLADRSPRSRFEILDVPFAELRQAGKSIGCTVNDAYLAGVAGGLRLYHEHFGVHVDEIPMGMPISTRSDADPSLGNQATPTLFAAPVGIVDPVERMMRFHEIVLSARHEPALDLLAGAANILVHLPDQLMTSPLAQLVKVDVAASQVKGLLTPTYLAGAQITRSYGFGPKVSLAAFIGMITHLDTCCIAVHADPAAITEPELFASSLRAGFEEVLSGAGNPKAERGTAAVRKQTAGNRRPRQK